MGAAADGDPNAWARLHDRYANLIWSIARAYRLDQADAADVCQTTWLRLAEHLGSMRDPRQVKYWLATTARREAQRALRRSRHVIPVEADFDLMPDPGGRRCDEGLLERERAGSVRRAFNALPGPCQTLLRVLMSEPSPSYAEVSAALDMPIGSIGPRRARCLERLRRECDLGEEQTTRREAS